MTNCSGTTILDSVLELKQHQNNFQITYPPNLVVIMKPVVIRQSFQQDSDVHAAK